MSVHFAPPAGRPPLHPATRYAIEQRIERLIAILDRFDGDPDMEEDDEDRCPAHDDCQGQAFYGYGGGDGRPGDPEDAEEDDPVGGAVDDEPHDGHENLIPIYAIDQSAGPINEVEAIREWKIAQDWDTSLSRGTNSGPILHSH